MPYSYFVIIVFVSILIFTYCEYFYVVVLWPKKIPAPQILMAGDSKLWPLKIRKDLSRNWPGECPLLAFAADIKIL